MGTILRLVGCDLEAKVFECHRDFLVKYKMTKEKCLGRGLSGEVILASFQNDPDDKRAVKVFHHNDLNAEIFLTETAILQEVNHPSILMDVEAFRCPSYYILCMPFYPGGSLTQHLPHMTKDRVIKCFLQMADAILYLHGQNIAHRDVKPDNILFDEDDNAILIDFGLAYHVTSHPLLRRVVGTKGYVPPEVFTDSKLDFFKCDLYALGVVLWNMVFQLKTSAYSCTNYLDYVKRNKRLCPLYRTFLHHLLQPDPEERWDDKQLVKAIYTFPKMSRMAEKLWGRKV